MVRISKVREIEKKMRKILFLIIFLGPQIVCAQKTESEISPDFNRYELDAKAKKIPLSEIVSRVEVVRLEETPSSLLSYVNNLEIVDDKFVFPSGDQGDVYVFSEKGELLKNINKLGNGPGEYTSIDDFWVKDGLISIYSRVPKKIRRYSLEGKFIDRKEVPYRAAHVVEANDGFVLDMEMNYIEEGLRYNIVLLDENLQRTALLKPYKSGEGRQYGIYMSQRSLRPYGNKTLYSRIMNDSLYMIGNKAVKALAHFDFGNQWLWNSESIVRQDALDMVRTKGMVWHLNPTVSKRFIYLTYLTSYIDSGSILIDRFSGKKTRIDTGDIVLGALLWDNDRLLVSVQSVDVRAILDSLDKSQWMFKEGTTQEEIESSENPVLMWLTFK